MEAGSVKIPSEAEYNTLRQEILETHNRELNLISIGLTATSAIVGYALTVRSPFLFIVPIFILALTLTQMNGCIYVVLSLAVYIRTRIEPYQKGLNWETTIYQLRSEFRRQKHSNPLTLLSESNYALGIIFLGLLCIAFAIAYSSVWYEYLISGAVAVFWSSFSLWNYLQIRRAMSGKLEEELEAQYHIVKVGNSRRNG